MIEMKERKHDVVIIGGGASGLAAAVELRMSSPELGVLVIEKNPEPGRKLRATGSGRCNITNTAAEGYTTIMGFFSRIGLVTRTYANGLVYPYSESAADVVSLLTERAEALGVVFACGEEVVSITECDKAAGRSSCRFEIESKYKDKEGEHSIISRADYVVLATGGKAGPSYGTTGDGYALARSVGHSIVTPVPALTGIECLEWGEGAVPDAHVLAGTRTAAVISLYRRDQDAAPVYDTEFFSGDYSNLSPVFRESGELQFTKYGLSGICIFNMTRHMRFDRSQGGSLEDYLVTANLFPDGSIANFIRETQKGAFADLTVDKLICTLFKGPVVRYLTGVVAAKLDSSSGVSTYSSTGKGSIYDKPVSALTDPDIKAICEAVHGLEFSPRSLRGWKDAQVTMGGVSLDEIDAVSCGSKLAEGLYITGELADRDYPCGGYNLSNAWITGLAAASDIAEKYFKDI